MSKYIFKLLMKWNHLSMAHFNDNVYFVETMDNWWIGSSGNSLYMWFESKSDV